VVFFPMVSSKSPFPPRSRPQTPDSPSLPTLSGPSSPQFQTPLSCCQPVSGHGSRNTDQEACLRQRAKSASLLFATLTGNPQLLENKTTLSPAVATLTHCVKHNSFVCHSYKKHRGVGCPLIGSRSRLLSLRHSCYAQQRPQPHFAHGFTSRFSGYPGGWSLKQFPATPRLLCKNRSANALDISLGSRHLPRGGAS
jgi:hypothetical protein